MGDRGTPIPIYGVGSCLPDEQGWEAPPTTIIVLQVASEEDIAIYKWYSTSALMMLIDRFQTN